MFSRSIPRNVIIIEIEQVPYKNITVNIAVVWLLHIQAKGVPLIQFRLLNLVR